MPYQDIEDDAAVEITDSPSAIERLLRKIFLEDLGIKLLALGITLIIWFAVTGENRPITIHTGVPLNFIRPPNMEISNDPPKTVDVLLTGSRHRLNNLRSSDLVATVDLSKEQPGERVIRLTQQRVDIDLPQGVKIESFQPNSISVRLEPVVERSIPIEVRLEGKPAEGYEVYRTQPTLSQVRVRGPASQVNELSKAPTEAVPVEGRKENFAVTGIAVDLPNQKLEVLDSTVDISVEIGERRVEKSFDNVPVRSSEGGMVQPSVASVTLSGSANVMEQLHSKDIVVIVDAAPGSDRTGKLQLPVSLQEKVRLVSIKPSTFR
jgi:YbbR domain-containing protein